MASNLQLLITDIGLLVIAIISLIGNGLVSALILLRPELRKNKSIYHTFALTMAYFLLSLLAMPYYVILVVGVADLPANETVNYSVKALIFSANPIHWLTLIIIWLTLGIAWDRMNALLRPIAYQMVNHVQQLTIFCVIGLIHGALGGVFHIVDAILRGFPPVPGCARVGCVQGRTYNMVYLISSVAVNLCATLFCSIIFSSLLLRKNAAKSRREANPDLDEQNLNHKEQVYLKASLVQLYIMISSTIFITVPETTNLVTAIIGIDPFKNIGPYVAIGLYLCGVCNGIIYGIKHEQIYNSFKKIVPITTARI